MADSPILGGFPTLDDALGDSSDDSVVTVINVARQELDDKTYMELAKSRREVRKEHYKLVQSTMIKIMGYSDRWHSTDDDQMRKEIGTGLVEQALKMYICEGDALAKDHHENFKDDNPLKNFFAGWSKFVANTIKGSRGDMQRAMKFGPNVEPVNVDDIRATLKDFREKFRKDIRDGNLGHDETADSFTSLLNERPTEERKEELRQKIFRRYKEYIIRDIDTEMELLAGFYNEGTDVIDPNFVLRLTLLEFSFQDDIDYCNKWRNGVTVNYVKKYGPSNFYFLNPLENHLPKSGKEKLERLGFKEPGLSEARLSEPEMRHIWGEAMDKLAEERMRVGSRKYDPVSGMPHSS